MPELNPKLSICIVSHNAYGAISGGTKGFIGGVEWQTSLLARSLAARGHRVSLITWDEGGPPDEIIEGVRVLKVCRQNEGLPGLRFFHPKWSSLTAALAKADAEVYYHNCGECVTGQMAHWCRRNGKVLVFSAASDADCDPRLPELKSIRERVLYRYGLRRADRVIAQTDTQRRKFSGNFGVSPVVIPMPCPGPSDAEFQPPRAAAGRVLWVGRVCRVKRPDRLVEMADACPGLQFDVAGPVYDDDYAQSVAQAAANRPNITMHGAVPRAQMPDLYRKASVLCCTSDYEGFPNTFLEAWSHGLPVVSTVDPDGLISSRELGRIADSPATLSHAIKELLGEDSLYQRVSGQARSYYTSHHTMEAVLPQFENLFAGLLRESGQPS
jgi:glycosyltransferase involved in cell wall biosynthesis